MTKLIDVISDAFTSAQARHVEFHTLWIQLSHSISSRKPHSLLTHSILKIGNLDLLLRSIEDEAAEPSKNFHAAEYHGFLSELWIGSTYEIFRVLVNDLKDETFKPIFKDLELIRVPLEKYQLRRESKLIAPLEFERGPAGNDESDIYHYDPKDPGRGHIMPVKLSEQGSWMWYVTDTETLKSFWIERRNLSDRILNILQ